MSNTVLAFLLTILAGLSTGIGSALAFFTKRTNTRFLAISLGFSAGVMIYISMAELFHDAKKILIDGFGEFNGTIFTIISFFAGMFIIALIDRFIPSFENPHEFKMIEDYNKREELIKNKKLMRMGILSALAIAMHNFPEGIATFASGYADIKFAIPIAIAIAIHNIPEGIAISVPIYFSTGSKRKAFFLSFLSGLAEPLGALLCLFCIQFTNDKQILGFIFSAVAGIMMFISLDELLPSARQYGEHHLSIYGLIAGMVTMAISLLVLT